MYIYTNIYLYTYIYIHTYIYIYIYIYIYTCTYTHMRRNVDTREQYEALNVATIAAALRETSAPMHTVSALLTAASKCLGAGV